MRLSIGGLSERELCDKGYVLPGYDVEAARSRALYTPRWIHFGAGNLFRAMIAVGVDRALGVGAMDCGLIACAGRDTVLSAYRPFDGAFVSVTLGADGRAAKQVVGCVARALVPGEAEDFAALSAMFCMKSLQLCSFTMTEKGYDPDGASERGDREAGPAAPRSLLGQLGALMQMRYRAGGHPIALVSMDNCARNGDRLRDGLLAVARAWVSLGYADAGFADYLADKARVSYPWTMIDKITPQPDPGIAEMLGRDGLTGMDIVRTARGALSAPFVNAEEPGYLVVEDDFPNGRPDLAACGFLLTDRETVSRAERMKVTACLNPLHTALALFGCLLGYERIAHEMKDPDLVALVTRLGYAEGLPVVADPGILDPRAFLDTVLQVRFPNPFMPDSPQRIATDTSQKLSIRFGETIKAHAARGDADTLIAVPMVLAGWLRYLTGIDDAGRAFARSPDPMLEELGPISDHLTAHGAAFDRAVIEPLLRDARVFGVDLVAVGLSERVLNDLTGMLTGPGAVRAAIRKMSLQ